MIGSSLDERFHSSFTQLFESHLTVISCTNFCALCPSSMRLFVPINIVVGQECSGVSNYFQSSAYIPWSLPYCYILEFIAWMVVWLRSTGEIIFSLKKVYCFCVSTFMNFQSSVSKNPKDLEGSLSWA